MKYSEWNAQNRTVVLRAKSDSMNAISALENPENKLLFETFAFPQSH